MSDLIYKQDVLDEILRFSSYFDKDMIIGVCIGLNRLPSAQPEQTKMIKEIREWINSENRGNVD